MKYSFVTVAYKDDFSLLMLQAKSMALYCDPNLIEEIIIVENFEPGNEIDWRVDLLLKYGKLSTLVKFVPGEQISSIPEKTYGWFSQQILKLNVSSLVKANRYVLLDTKNHLVKPLTLDFLETPEGRPRINGYSYVSHTLLRHLKPTLEYFGLNPEDYIHHFTRTSPPFTMITSVARAAVKYVQTREEKSIGQVFTDRQFTEFFLYSSFLIFVGCMEDVYDWSQKYCGELWKEDVSIETVRRITTIHDHSGPFLSIHRAAIALLGDDARTELSTFWYNRQLFNSVDRGIQYLKTGDISTL